VCSVVSVVFFHDPPLIPACPGFFIGGVKTGDGLENSVSIVVKNRPTF
jgi:hypothetical protein